MVKKMKGWREDAPQGRKPTAPDGCEVEYDFAKSCYRTDENPPRYWTGSKQLGGQGWAAQPLTKKKRAELKEFPAAAAAAQQQAEVEGLELLLAPGTITGFEGVVLQHGANLALPYRAQTRKDGRTVGLGTFRCKEEAALCYARALGPEGIARRKAERSERTAPVPTDEEIFAQAASEGLELIPEANSAGYKGVSIQSANESKPFVAVYWQNNTRRQLGMHPTAAAAALAVARARREATASASAEGSASYDHAEAAVAREHIELLELSTPAAVAARAEAEGLQLTRADTESGYKSVLAVRSKRVRGGVCSYVVKTYLKGVPKQRGKPFPLAEQAALYYARCVKRDAEAGEEHVSSQAQQKAAADARKAKVRAWRQPHSSQVGKDYYFDPETQLGFYVTEGASDKTLLQAWRRARKQEDALQSEARAAAAEAEGQQSMAGLLAASLVAE